MAVSGISSAPVQSRNVLTIHWGKFLVHREQTSVLHHLGTYLSAELVHHMALFQFSQTAGKRCTTAVIPLTVTAVRHHKRAGSSLVCTQAALCREDGGNGSLPAALGAHTACHGQMCTQGRADVTRQKVEEGRALK